MKLPLRVVPFAATIGLLSRSAQAGPPPADLVLKNGVVHTVAAKARAEAVAVRAGRIVAVGSTAEVEPLVGPKTRVIDLAGRAVVPGFRTATPTCSASASRG